MTIPGEAVRFFRFPLCRFPMSAAQRKPPKGRDGAIGNLLLPVEPLSALLCLSPFHFSKFLLQTSFPLSSSSSISPFNPSRPSPPPSPATPSQSSPPHTTPLLQPLTLAIMTAQTNGTKPHHNQGTFLFTVRWSPPSPLRPFAMADEMC